MSLICILFCRPVHGLIFLFKWQPGEEPAGSVVQDSRLDTIFFAKQVWSLDTLKSLKSNPFYKQDSSLLPFATSVVVLKLIHS